MLRIGKILKSNGTDGGLLISAPEVELEQIEGPVYVEFDGLPAPFFFDSLTKRGSSRYIAHMTGVRSLRDAEEMVGRDILFDGEFEEEDAGQNFVGWTVLDRDVELGVVEDYEPIPGNFCVYVLRPSGSQGMIPLHEDFVLSVDHAARRLVLSLPAGLY